MNATKQIVLSYEQPDLIMVLRFVETINEMNNKKET